MSEREREKGHRSLSNSPYLRRAIIGSSEGRPTCGRNRRHPGSGRRTLKESDGVGVLPSLHWVRPNTSMQFSLIKFMVTLGSSPFRPPLGS